MMMIIIMIKVMIYVKFLNLLAGLPHIDGRLATQLRCIF